ncbi:MAG: tartrate dehydrogenase [Gammaproteobacteria bacterium]|nr:tartrate dehydrogenase [Gammaproteobacteria bacterium]MDE2263180.1 tartrate dehydrogenase [Gammaproteobacteria bacterium]
MSRHRIALIPGDGIGREVLPAGVEVLVAAGERFGISFEWDERPWGCDHYLQTGRMMPPNALAEIRHHDAIYLGAVGFPGVPDHISLWGLLIEIRRGFDQYVCLRPIRLMPHVASPLRDRGAGDIDIMLVRENTEGEYSDRGRRLKEGTAEETVIQESIFTRRGVDRIMRYAFELASRRPRRKLTWATKSNGITLTMPFWDERAALIAREYPGIAADHYHIDILAAHFVQRPQQFDVVVASNLFGDILSDLGAGCAGTIGIAPSANINPEREYPSMFEPVHGSAPDITGRNIANPIGQIWSGAMMLEHLGHAEAAAAVVAAIETVLRTGPRTRDLGGTASTREVGEAIAQTVRTIDPVSASSRP